MNSSRNRLKVIYVIDHLGMGGAQRQLTELVRLISKESFDIEVISLSKEKQDYVAVLEEAGIPVTLIDHHGKWSWTTLRAVCQKFREAKPEIVHTWLFTADLYGQLAAFRTGVSHVISAMRNTIDDMPWHCRLVYKMLSRKTSCITINAEVARFGLVEKLGISSEKIRTIYNGIDLAKFLLPNRNGHYKEEWKLPKDAKVVAMVARMSRQKDYATFLEAAKKVTKQFPNTYFVLVGDGPLRPQIERKIQELNLGVQTRVLGACKDAWEIIQHVDVCALATHYEGCSNIIMEAMAASRPIVATDVGGNRELIVHGQTGLLVPPKDSNALASAIQEFLRDAQKAKIMGEAARNRTEKHFTLDQTVHDTEALYHEVVIKRETEVSTV